MPRQDCTNAGCLMPCCDLYARPPSGPLRLWVKGWMALKTGVGGCGRPRPAAEAKCWYPGGSELADGYRVPCQATLHIGCLIFQCGQGTPLKCCPPRAPCLAPAIVSTTFLVLTLTS